jgi:hypothetical protein
VIYISTEKSVIIDLILKEFQNILISLDISSNQVHNNYGYSPKSAIVKYHDRYDPTCYSRGNINSAWVIYLDKIETLSDLNYRALSKPIDGMYFSEGSFYFSINPDSSKAIIEWIVGPLFGRGYVYSIDNISNKLKLTRDHRIWAS